MNYRKILAAAFAVSLLVGPGGCRKQDETSKRRNVETSKRRSGEAPKRRNLESKKRQSAIRNPQSAIVKTATAPSITPESALALKRKRTQGIEWPKAGPEAPNILIITIDTLRAGHLGCYGYFRNTSPNIDAFAKECLFFENCLAPVAQTLPTHTSLFTGVYPREHGIMANLAFTRTPDNSAAAYKPSPYLFTFATVLSKTGYTTVGFVSAEPVKKASGLAAGFQTWHEPQRDESHTVRDKVIASVTLKKVYAWLAEGRTGPFMCWIHLFDPHASYAAPKPYGSMFKTDDALEEYMAQRQIPDKASKQRRAGLDPKVWDSRNSINGYDGEIAFTDLHLGKLFDKLREAGLWDTTAIVLTSDHGEGLGQHHYPEHNEIWQEQLHVPLMMRIPGRAGRRIATRMSTIDILPTLLGILGDVPGGEIFLEQCTGTNVLAADYQPRALYVQHPRTRAGIFANSIIVDGWKYIMYNPGAPKHRRKENKLFNLGEDPFELNDLIQQYPDRAATLQKRLKTIIAEQNGRGMVLESGKTVPISKERVSRMKDLGYVDEDEEEEDADDDGGDGEKP